MGKWTAPSSDDYWDEQEGRGRMVGYVCPICHERFHVEVSAGPPVGEPVCDDCGGEHWLFRAGAVKT